MPDHRSPLRRRVSLDVPWGTLFKILIVLALAWLGLQLIPIALILAVAVILAVALSPLVSWLERRRLSRSWAVAVVSLGLLLLVGGFLLMTWSSLSDQGRYMLQQLGDVQQRVVSKLPSWVRNALGLSGDGGSGGAAGGEAAPAAGSYAVRFARSVTSAITVTVFGFILTIYLLTEGRQTRDWLLAFVPRRHRTKVRRTLDEGETVVLGYMAGNVVTSLIATGSTLIALWALKVPAALVLALIAGLSDFIPVIGFPLSAIPAILLALTVSNTAALLVVAFYVAYNTVENYVIGPWAYGNRLKLSNVAVILAFAIGAQIAGVIGALIALPIAALYPPIERIWLRDRLAEKAVEKHEAIEKG